MARPTVLVVEGQDARRKELVRGLDRLGYEVVAAADADEGRKFAAGLDPSVLVCEPGIAALSDEAAIALPAPGEGQGALPLLILIWPEEDIPERPEGLRKVIYLQAAGLAPAGVLRKLSTALLALELGLEADVRLESLMGEFENTPLFDLLPQLQRAVVTGRMLIGDGEIDLIEGEVADARAGGARGIKAFARLGRTHSGRFRLMLSRPGGESAIAEDLLSAIAVALEDRYRFDEMREQLPGFGSRVRLVMGPSFFATHFTPSQQVVLAEVQAGGEIYAILDRVAAPDGQVLASLVELQRLGFLAFDEPEAKVRIVTDSTCDLPPELAIKNRVHIVPLTVIFGEDIFKDGVDLTPAAFYKLLKSRREHPHTSPPSKGEFLADYRRMVPSTDIVSLHLSAKQSQTVVNARAAASEGREEFDHLRSEGSPVVEVIDSALVSVGLAVQVLFAARMANRGMGAHEIRERIGAMRGRIHLLFVVDTLEFLARGGRIGRAKAAIGEFLHVKPILGQVDGEVAEVDKVRGGKAAHPRLVELFKERVDATRPVIIGIGHADAPAWAERLRTLLTESFTVIETIETEIGPVVGTHVGPGCVGVVVFQPTDEEAALLAP